MVYCRWKDMKSSLRELVAGLSVQGVRQFSRIQIVVQEIAGIN